MVFSEKFENYPYRHKLPRPKLPLPYCNLLLKTCRKNNENYNCNKTTVDHHPKASYLNIRIHAKTNASKEIWLNNRKSFDPLPSTQNQAQTTLLMLVLIWPPFYFLFVASKLCFIGELGRTYLTLIIENAIDGPDVKKRAL